MNAHLVSEKPMVVYSRNMMLNLISIFGKTIGNGYALTAVVGKRKLWTLRRLHLSQHILDREDWAIRSISNASGYERN